MFIVLEGSDGCGKGTQSRLLKQYLGEKGVRYTHGEEPGTSPLGGYIRKVLLRMTDIDMTPDAQLLAFFMSRFQNTDTVLRPALEEGYSAVWDRWDHSSYAYQVRAGNADEGLFWELSNRIIRPDLTLVLDVGNIREALDRAKGVSGEPDRFEDKLIDFHERVCEAYRAMPETFPKDNVHLVPWGSVEEVHGNIVDIVEEEMRKRS